MHQGVQWVDPVTSVEHLAQLMREHDIGAIRKVPSKNWTKALYCTC
jgi:hypothetical protein